MSQQSAEIGKQMLNNISNTIAAKYKAGDGCLMINPESCDKDIADSIRAALNASDGASFKVMALPKTMFTE